MTRKLQKQWEPKNNSLSRRNLMAIGVMAAAIGLPTAAHVSIESYRGAESSILAVFSDSSAAAQVGKAVLSSWPGMRDRARILAHTLNDLGLTDDSVLQVDVSEIARRLSQRVRADFAAGRTIMVGGWLLSLTESRFCVLAALAGN